jgi:50S ribosomal protein L16 3-hydroxylase
VGAVFGSITPSQFLARHWQREPLLFSGALPDFRSPLTPDELAGLACEEEVESRIVLGHVGSRFELEHGPFEEERFERLPKRDWTLLVQDVDKHVPEVARLLQAFRALPDWRIDDIMVSFAAPGGSVGPHTDQYDVFLLQAQGRRRWQLSERFNPELRGDCDLKVLARFEPERELIAEPGDILYLPPNVAHFGVALDEAMTFSIGFRAPDQRELAGALARELCDDARQSLRFVDAGRGVVQDPTELAPGDLERLRELVRTGLSPSDAELDAFIGRYLTRAKPNLELAAEATPAAVVKRRLERGERVQRRQGSRWAWLRRGAELSVFAEGYESRLRESQRAWVQPLLAHTALGADAFAADETAHACLARWLEQGALDWQGEDDDDDD